MDEGTEKIIRDIRFSQLETNGWRGEVQVAIARVEESVKEIAKDEKEAHENIGVIRKDLSILTNTVTQIATINAEKIQQLENWKSGLWPKALGILAVFQIITGVFLSVYLKGH